jgi:hypothetical protein
MRNNRRSSFGSDVVCGTLSSRASASLATFYFFQVAVKRVGGGQRTLAGLTGPLPAAVRADQGCEFVSRDLGLWGYQRGSR